MGYRATYYYCAITFAWAFLAIFSFLSNNARYQIPVSSALTAVASGLIAGVVYGSAVTLKQFQFLARDGEIRTTLTTWLYIIGAIFIIIAVTLLLAESLPLATEINVLYFLYALVPASMASRTLLFFGWELRHKRRILFANLVSSRLYVFPKIEVAHSQE